MGLADFLFSPTQQKILGPLLMSPGRSYRVLELLRMAGSGRGGAQVQLNKLLKAGVLLEEWSGNQKHIQINTNFPFYSELRSICLKSFGLIEKFRQILSDKKGQIKRAFIFGSIASGKDTATSDIDLMVIGEVGYLDLLDLIVAAEIELGRTIHINFHSEEEWDKKQKMDSVILDILQKPILEIFPNDAA